MQFRNLFKISDEEGMGRSGVGIKPSGLSRRVKRSVGTQGAESRAQGILGIGGHF